MAHKIFGQRFISRREPAWHNLGTIFPEGATIQPVEAVKRVAGDIHIERVPLYYELGGNRRDADHFGIVRLPTNDDPEPLVLGVTSERWHPTTYPELARSLDKMDAAVYKVETCGLLSGGALCFIALRGEDWSVLGQDAMKTYFLVNLSLQPGVGHRVVHTTVRVVCNNTNEAAIASSNIQLRVQHGADAAQQIGLAGDLVMRFRSAQDETKAIFDQFASTPAPREAVETIFRKAWPDPVLPARVRLLKNVVGEEGMEVFKKGLDPAALDSIVLAQERFEKQMAHIEEVREGGWDRYENFQPVPLRGTVWAAYNAVTETADWRGDGKTVGESVLIGSRGQEKIRAFGAACEVCNVGT